MNQERYGFFRRFLQSPISHLLPYPAANRQEEMQLQALLRHLLREARSKELWDIPLTETRFVVLDTETTGFHPQRDVLISIGAVEMLGEHIHLDRTYYSLIQPDPIQPIPPAVAELTGIRNEDLMSAPPIAEVLESLVQFMQDSVLVMHHAAHDLQFLNAALQKTSGLRLTHHVIDTCDVAKWIYSCPEHFSLDDLLARRAIPIKGRHTAIGDATMTAKLWQTFLRDIQRRDIATVGELLETLFVSKQTRYRPFP